MQFTKSQLRDIMFVSLAGLFLGWSLLRVSVTLADITMFLSVTSLLLAALVYGLRLADISRLERYEPDLNTMTVDNFERLIYMHYLRHY